MLSDIGYIATILTLISAGYAVVTALYGYWQKRPAYVDSAHRAGVATWPWLTLAVGTLLYAILRDDFSIEYVANYSSRSQPIPFKISAVWAGQNGSILFWGWIMATFSLALLVSHRKADWPMRALILMVTMGTLAFFVGLNVFMANPFATLDFVPADGLGLDPLLRHTAMIYHPPTLYLGYVGFIIPFALVIAALVTHRLDADWLATIRRWTLLAWLFLGIGIILGMVWAYDVLGWGGYWAWDPVENAALLPWLTGTAFIHSLSVQKYRGMFKSLNVSLITLTYFLAILGTFATRTGLVGSVHAFARSSIGIPFLIFLALTVVGGVAVLLHRLDDLRGRHRLDSLVSREAAVLLSVLLLLTITFSVFVGSYFPLLSQVITHEKRTVGPPWFNRVVGPQMAFLVAVMGVCPLLAWRRTSNRRLGRGIVWPLGLSLAGTLGLFAAGIDNPGALVGLWICLFVAINILGEFWRGVRARHRSRQQAYPLALVGLFGKSRQRYGGYLTHLGIVLMTLGVIGTTSFKLETQGTLSPGDSVELGDFQLTYERLRSRPFAEGSIIEAVVQVGRGGDDLGRLYPRIEFYQRRGARSSVVAARSTLAEDVYISFTDWQGQGDSATFKFYVNPLVAWLWIGGGVLVAGTLLAAWPPRAAKKRARSGGE